jgi:hypothetical protein
VAPRRTRRGNGEPGVNVRRLAALDMHGRYGTARRRFVLAEFILAALGGLALGGFVLAAASGIEAVVIGV